MDTGNLNLSVRSPTLSVAEVFLPLQICAIGLHLYGETRVDSKLTEEIVKSLTSIYAPFVLHIKRRIVLQHYNVMAEKFSCLVHLVIYIDRPNFRSQVRMDGLLKRFRRGTGSDNDYVLVLTPEEDQVAVRTEWTAAFFNRVRPMLFPYNALLLELSQIEGKQQQAVGGYNVKQMYRMHFYCNQVQEICWERSWPPRGTWRNIAVTFPQNRMEFDKRFSRVLRDWHQNFNLWSIYLHNDFGAAGDLDKIPFRLAIGPATEVYRKLKTAEVPLWFLISQVARTLNATLKSMSAKHFYEQGAEIHVEVFARLPNWAWFLTHPKITVGSTYFRFAYGTNGTGQHEAANIMIIFSPFHKYSWLLIATSTTLTTILLRFGGGISTLDTMACFVGPTRGIKLNQKLALLFLLWSLFSFFLAASYSQFIESALAVPALVPRIQDFRTLNEQGYRPVVNKKEKEVLDAFFRGYTFTDALANDLDVQDIDIKFDLSYVRYLAGNEKRCAIFIDKNSIEAELWLHFARMGAPGVTWSVGKKVIPYAPLFWSFLEPNGAMMYYTFGILHSTGFINKFRSYVNEKELKYDAETMNSEEGRRAGYGQVQNRNEEMTFTIHNPQVLAIFQAFAVLNSLGLLTLLLEVATSIVELRVT